MSNKLKTISVEQLEQLIAEKISSYIDEQCSCSVSNISTPNIDSEENIALHNERDLTFEVRLSYKEPTLDG